MKTKKNNNNIVITSTMLRSLHEQIVNQHVFIQPGYLHSLRTGLRQMYMSGDLPDISDFMFLFGGGNEVDRVTVKNGVARISVSGPIYNDDPEDYLVRSGYVASYKAIRQDFESAKNNEDVKVAVFDIESPGGLGGPLFDLMEEIYEARDVLPTIAYIENYGFSAAQGIAAACTETWISRGASCGSVGSIIVHEDISEALKMDGINIETFVYGKKKDQGASFKPLSDEARSDYNDTVSKHGKEFTELTAKFLGKEFKSIKALEAGTFSGLEAIDVGLAHKVVQGHTVQSEVEAKFSLTKTRKGKGVESKMDLITLKSENPEEYQKLMDEAKAEAKAELKVSDDNSGDGKEADGELTAKVDQLKTIVESQGKVIESQTKQLKDQEKLEAIRKAKDIQVKAEGILSSALNSEECLIPQNLHSKVEVNHIKFLSESGELDVEAYTAAVTEEVKDWETKFAKEKGSDVLGFGSGGDDTNVKDSKADMEVINDMRKQAGLAPIEA